MKSMIKRGFSLMLVLAVLVSLLSGLSVQTQAAGNVNYVYSGKYIYNWGTREETATFLSPNAEEFYEDNNVTYEDLAALSGSSTQSSVPSSALYKRLQNLMSSNHSHITSYDETRSLYQYTDCQDSGRWNSKKISSFYSGKAIGPSWDSGKTWNREHTWPNSKGSGSGENDIMMLRPTAVSENSGRGNTAYGESTGYYNPNSMSNGTYDLRGDCARIMLYVYVRWGNTQTMWGKAGVMESKQVLLKWIEEDPVDTWELGRNDSVEAITGTRNVFVDYPELAFILFDAVIPADMQTPSGNASNYNFEVSAVSNNPDFGTVTLNGLNITAKPAEGYIANGYTVLNGTAQVTQTGNTFQVAPKSDCTIQINFVPKTACTIRFAENGAVTRTMAAYTGDLITMPQRTVTVQGYTFVGWSAVEVEHTSKEPTYYAAGSQYEVTADTTFYALYSYGVVGTGNAFQKVTQAPANWEGEYVITSAAGSGNNRTDYAFLADGTDPGTSTAVREFSEEGLSVSGDILKGVTDRFVVIVEKVGTSYSLRLKGASSTLYLMTDNTNGGFNTVSNTSNNNARWNLSYSDGSVNIQNVAYTSRKLRFNDGNLLFRTYTSGQQPLVLYKRSGSAMEDFYTTLTVELECPHDNTSIHIVEATCTAAGTISEICDDCQEVLRTAELTKLDHSYTAVVTVPTCEENGYTTYTCDCGDSYIADEVPATDHTYEEGICTGCGQEDPDYVKLPSFAGMTMSLGNSLAVNFVFNTGLLEGDGHYAVITKEYADDTVPVSVTIPREQWQVYSGKLYYFTFTGVKAKEMTDTFTVVIYNAQGEQVSVAYKRTIEDYCCGQIKKYEQEDSYDAERLALYVDILKYGAAAQDYFEDYNMDNLATANLTAQQLAYGTASVQTSDIRVKGSGYMGSTLLLQNEILLNFVFANVMVNKTAYAVVSYTHHDGSQVEVVIQPEDFVAYGTSGKYITVPGLKMADYQQVVTITLYNAQGNALSTSSDSVASYVFRMSAADPVYAAVVKLGKSSYDYFH